MKVAQPVVERYLEHLRVERRLAARTLAMYEMALLRLQRQAEAAGTELAQVQPQEVRRWAAQLHADGLAPRSVALDLSAWRGLYRWLGREGEIAANPVAGVRAPKAAKPLPKALSVDQSVALAEHRAAGGDPALEARDACIVEMLYGSLDTAQLRLISDGIRASPFDAQAWMGERLRRQAETLQTLRRLVAEKADGDRRVAALRALVERAQRSPDPGYRAYQNRLIVYNCAFAARIHNAMKPGQRQALAERLKGWEDELRNLASASSSPASPGPQQP